MKRIGQELTDQNLCEAVHSNLKPLLGEYQLIEKRRDCLNPPIDSSKYNFTFMAYPVLNNLTHNTADHLLDLLHYSEAMTHEKQTFYDKVSELMRLPQPKNSAKQ